MPLATFLRLFSAGSLLLMLLVACEPARQSPELACTKNAQCPADGNHYCNLKTSLCEACDGLCPSQIVPDVTTTDTQDALDSTADTTTDAATDTATDTVADADDAAGTDAEADLADDTTATR